MLHVEAIHSYYGLSHILFNVSLNVYKGEIVCLLGRNGVGKSTTMKSIMGLVPPKQGRVFFKGENITHKKAHIHARRGIGYVPDDRRVFADLTVRENLEIAARVGTEKKYWNKQRVYDLFPPLQSIKNRKAGNLSGGEQQMLTIGRALMTNPELLLLDEPTEGLAPLIVTMLEKQITKLKENGLTVLLAEQNMHVALRLSDRAYVIDNGVVRYHGTIDQLKSNPTIRDTYLGI